MAQLHQKVQNRAAVLLLLCCCCAKRMRHSRVSQSLLVARTAAAAVVLYLLRQGLLKPRGSTKLAQFVPIIVANQSALPLLFFSALQAAQAALSLSSPASLLHSASGALWFGLTASCLLVLRRWLTSPPPWRRRNHNGRLAGRSKGGRPSSQL